MTVINLGIDLGTTFSSIAVYDPQIQKIQLIEDPERKTEIASHVKITKTKDGEKNYIVGNRAKEATSKTTLYNSKRLIGKSFKDFKEIDKNGETTGWRFEVYAANEDQTKDDRVKMFIDNKNSSNEIREDFYPEEISAFILKYLVDCAKDKYPNAQIGKIVVTIPVDFSVKQRQATLRACKLAGLNTDNIELINEPTASLMCYHHFYQLKVGDKCVVVDFGGGTFDVCCCIIEQNPNEVRVTKHGMNDNIVNAKTTKGDHNLGGNDFDKAIYDLLLQKIVEKHIEILKEENENENKSDIEVDADFQNDLNDLFIINEKVDSHKKKEDKKKRINRVVKVCEEMKIKLSVENETSKLISEILGEDDADNLGFDYEDEIIITRDEFKDICVKKDLIKRFIKCLDEAIEESGFVKDNIDLILPIGGTCKIPFLREEIHNYFGKARRMADSKFDPLTAVAQGAAVRAHNLETSNGKELRVKMPYTIGIETVNDGYDQVIKMGWELPQNNVQRTYWPAEDYQTRVVFNLLKGEAEKSNDPTIQVLDTVMISGIPPKTKKADYPMDATFNVNTSGIITVDVVEQKKGNKPSKQLKANLGLIDYNATIDSMKEHMDKFKK